MRSALMYADTSTWNGLCDQAVDARRLTLDLEARGVQLTLGTNAVYEMAKTFKSGRSNARQRGQELFSYLRQYVELGIRLLRETEDLVREELRHVAKEIRDPELFYGSADYEKLVAEVDRLAQGILNPRTAQFIPLREAEAAQSRHDLYTFIDDRPQLKRKLGAIPEESVGRWIAQEMQRSARRILTGHLAHITDGQPLRNLTWLAKRLLASSRYRVSHAMVRSDLYLNWRYCQRGSLGKDMPDDHYHAVNASYCDYFVTSDPGLARYMSDVLTQTHVALYDRGSSIANWLLAICGES
jgi:hypothetical protein